jgi:protein-S-isoprenylcysteine O-methyltransferase Ste14
MEENGMYRYLLCIGICTILWIVNIKWIIQAIRERIPSEIYIHTGLGIFFTLLTVELTLGLPPIWGQYLLWLKILGFLLYIPASMLLFGAIRELKGKGNTETADLFDTTAIVNTGIYGIIRQPITLGSTIWSIALMFVFQSLFSIILGILSIFCFWMSARTEGAYNIRKFGDAYRKYMKNVPMWNVISGLKKRSSL